jgi:hypothetical protein
MRGGNRRTRSNARKDHASARGVPHRQLWTPPSLDGIGVSLQQHRGMPQKSSVSLGARFRIRELGAHRLLTVAEENNLDPREFRFGLVDLARDRFDVLADLFPV